MIRVEDFLEKGSGRVLVRIRREGEEGEAGKMWTYINRDVNADAVVFGPGVSLVVPFLGDVVAYYQGVLRKLFIETFGCCYVDVEVEGLGHRGQGQEGEETPHLCFFRLFMVEVPMNQLPG